MKKTTTLAVVAASVHLCACNKEYNPGTDPNVTPTGNYYTMQSAMTEVAVQPKTVTLNATTGGTFNGNSGTRYEFKPNSFRTASGTLVTGNVTITVSEYLKKSDMLFSGVPPVSNGEPLISGGEFDIKAEQGGQTLQLAPNTSFRANMPVKTTNVDGMQVFNATRDPNTGAPNWRIIDTSANRTVIGNGNDTISLTNDSLTMCNADRFMNHPNYQHFSVSVTSGGTIPSSDSMMIYAFYDTYNGVWPMHFSSSTTADEGHVPDIPVHFVVLGISNGQFYGGIMGATPQSGKNYTINLNKTTPKEFKKLVDAL